jgi:uncharacterized membrane protein YcgQ (UPF0703/DUF1980 family)
MGRAEGKAFSSVRFARKITLFAYGYFLLFLASAESTGHHLREEYEPAALFAAALLIAISIFIPSSRKPNDKRRRSKSRFIIFSDAAALCAMAVLLFPVFKGLTDAHSAVETLSFLFEEEHGHELKLFGPVDFQALKKPHPSDISIKKTDSNDSDDALSYAPLNIAELHMLLGAGGDAFEGDRVALRGWVAQINTDNDSLTLSRNVVSCCKSHSFPVTIDISGKQTNTFSKGDWIMAMGRIRKKNPEAPPIKNTERPEADYFIVADLIERAKEPNDPYINKSVPRKPFQY